MTPSLTSRPVAEPMLVAAEQLVARLPVYRTLVSLVAVSDSLVGVAVSDVYLSCARPLPSAATAALPSATQLAAAHQCGALVLGLPFSAGGLHKEHTARQQRLAALVKADSQLLVCAFGPAQPPTAAELAQRHRDNLLWEQTGLEELGKHGEARDASIMAALVLQVFLDDHAGGWANTSG